MVKGLLLLIIHLGRGEFKQIGKERLID